MKYMTTCALICAPKKGNLIIQNKGKDDIYWRNDSKYHLFLYL